jgi:hypothetical protein
MESGLSRMLGSAIHQVLFAAMFGGVCVLVALSQDDVAQPGLRSDDPAHIRTCLVCLSPHRYAQGRDSADERAAIAEEPDESRRLTNLYRPAGRRSVTIRAGTESREPNSSPSPLSTEQ